MNPRSPAPKADTLIRARLRALLHAFWMEYLHFSLCSGWITSVSWIEPLQRICCVTKRSSPSVGSACLLSGCSCTLESLLEKLKKIVVGTEPFECEPYRGRVIWVKPKLVCEVVYMAVTPDLSLRHPRFRGLREDKAPSECTIDQILLSP